MVRLLLPVLLVLAVGCDWPPDECARVRDAFEERASELGCPSGGFSCDVAGSEDLCDSNDSFLCRAAIDGAASCTGLESARFCEMTCPSGDDGEL